MKLLNCWLRCVGVFVHSMLSVVILRAGFITAVFVYEFVLCLKMSLVPAFDILLSGYEV